MSRAALSHCLFQSTPPSRGATDTIKRYPHDAIISIHAPLAGSDRHFISTATGKVYFNPRPPRGERQRCGGSGRGRDISIHAPLAGSDLMGDGVYAQDPEFQSTPPSRGATGYVAPALLLTLISIHAPLAGSDRANSTPTAVHSNFNPRPPRGERPLHHTDIGADGRISIHAPLAGSDGNHA